MVDILLVGEAEPQLGAVAAALDDWCREFGHRCRWTDGRYWDVLRLPDLMIVAGYRWLVPAPVLEAVPLGVVGFHSAKLPEFPGRAPVYWTLLRGDEFAHNTMLYLDAGVDSGDVIDARSRPVAPGETPESLYRWVAETDAEMLRVHLPALVTGTAPRAPQDPARRGPLTTADGYQLYHLGRQADVFG